MSQKVVRYEGDGRARRPVYEDLGPASGRIVGEFGEGKTALLTGTAVLPTGGAGKVERRQITAAEIDARRTWDGRQTSDEIQASRMRGAARTSAIHAERRAAEEEPAVVDPVPEAASGVTEPTRVTLAVLRDAVATAEAAWQERLLSEQLADQAQLAWMEALQALHAAYRAMADPPLVEPVSEARASLPEIIPGPAAPAAIGGGPGTMPPYVRRMVDALVASGGDRKAAAAALGQKLESLTGSLSAIRKRTDLTEIERAAVAAKRG